MFLYGGVTDRTPNALVCGGKATGIIVELVLVPADLLSIDTVTNSTGLRQASTHWHVRS